jgi:hypothetical protein
MHDEVAQHPAERAQLVEPKCLVAGYCDRCAGTRKPDGLGALRCQEQRKPAVPSGAQPNEEGLLNRLNGCDDGRFGAAADANRAAATELAERAIDLKRLCLPVDPDLGPGLAAVPLGHDC